MVKITILYKTQDPNSLKSIEIANFKNNIYYTYIFYKNNTDLNMETRLQTVVR